MTLHLYFARRFLWTFLAIFGIFFLFQVLLDLVEQIRRLSKSAREGSAQARDELQAVLQNLHNEQLVPVARAFSQFLNLANIADQHHNVSRAADPQLSASRSLAVGLEELLAEGVAPSAVVAVARAMSRQPAARTRPVSTRRCASGSTGRTARLN